MTNKINKYDRITNEYEICEAYDELYAGDNERWNRYKPNFGFEELLKNLNIYYLNKCDYDDFSKDAVKLTNIYVRQLTALANDLLDNLYYCPECGRIVLQSETKNLDNGISVCSDCYEKQ